MGFVSKERQQFNEVWLPKLAECVPNGSLVYDIGKSDLWNYQHWLPGKTVKTIDRDHATNPDYVTDMEEDRINWAQAGGVICIGVTEQCDNPFKLVKGVSSILAPNGFALFCVLLLGYQHTSGIPDYFRFTEAGALRLLGQYFKAVEYFNFQGSCLFYLGSKK